MSESPESSPSPSSGSTSDRLDSWKEIASYLRRDVTTVQRWEKREGMPVHRHVHDKMGTVHAFRSELDAWARSRVDQTDEEPRSSPQPSTSADAGTAEPGQVPADVQPSR